MKNCCNVSAKNKQSNTSKCKRIDGKVFSLPRKFSQKQCKHASGFTMRASCAPYKYCKTKYQNKSYTRKKRIYKNRKSHVIRKLRKKLK